jgi:hypothetical protein
MPNFDKELLDDIDEIDALFARRNHLAPPVSALQIANTMRQLRQQPMPYRSVWHKQPGSLWGGVAVALAFSFFFISTLVGNIRPETVTQTIIRPFAAGQAEAMHTPGISITPMPQVANFQTLTIVPVPAFNQSQTSGESFKTVLAKPQTLPPNR